MDGEYTDAILAYFCFPTLGVAIPLRAGDQFIFNPCVPHMVSSRCHNEIDIVVVSLYLKSKVVGLNDNSVPLTPEQEAILNATSD